MRIEIKVKNILLFILLVIVAVFFINKSFAAETAKVNVETANLRETADSNGKILELLSLNDKVEIIEKQDNWYKVKAKGITGYLREDLIEVSGEENTENNTEEAKAQETTAEVNATAQETLQTEESDENKKAVVENTKLKIVPTINATDIIEVKKDEQVIITETVGNWVCIETQNTKGWIRKDKLKAIEQEEVKQEEENKEEDQEQQQEEPTQEQETKTLFTVKEANLRKEPSTNSEVITTLAVNIAVEVSEETNGWSKVKVSGKEGYISSALLSDTRQETSRGADISRTQTDTNTNAQTQTATTASAPISSNSGSVVSTAQSYIGKASYAYGASGPNSFDCSGFTSYIYKQYGVSLNRTAQGQYSDGTAVSRSDLQPGDLVMFGSSASSINHVGIYVGGGTIVHAANSSRGVTTDTINSGYYNSNYVGARRVM